MFGEILKVPKEKELSQVCCESCYIAQEVVCVCKCHGAYHGLGHLNKAKIDTSYEKELPEAEAAKFREQYDADRVRCLCGYNISKEPIVYYIPHSDGWTVKGEKTKAWLYVKCPNCGYDMAVWKMGVLRE